MATKQILSQEDVRMATCFVLKFVYFIAFYILTNLFFFIIFDVYDDNKFGGLVFISWFFLWLLLFIVPKLRFEKISAFLYKNIAIKSVAARRSIFSIISLSQKIAKVKTILIRPFVFLPLIIINLLIAFHGVAVLKDWLVYIDPVMVAHATSKSILDDGYSRGSFDKVFCWIGGARGKPKRRDYNRVCDIRIITYEGKSEIRKMFYYIGDGERISSRNSSSTIVASRLFPSNMTSVDVITQYSIIRRIIKLVILTSIFTLFFYFCICPNRLKTRFLRWMEVDTR